MDWLHEPPEFLETPSLAFSTGKFYRQLFVPKCNYGLNFNGYMVLPVVFSKFYSHPILKYGAISTERKPSLESTVGALTLHASSTVPSDFQPWFVSV